MKSEQTWLSDCLSLLDGMNSGQPMGKPQIELYRHALLKIGEEYGKRAILHCAETMTWRPAPAELLNTAADIASPIPSADACYEEIITAAQEKGLFARPDPQNENVYLPGPPHFSHPIVESLVRRCGGWEAICLGEANLSMGLRKQVDASHETLSIEWRRAVTEQLSLPAAQRNHSYFPSVAPKLPERVKTLAIAPARLSVSGNVKDNTSGMSAAVIRQIEAAMPNVLKSMYGKKPRQRTPQEEARLIYIKEQGRLGRTPSAEELEAIG